MNNVKFTLEELLPETAKPHLEAALFDLMTLNAPIAVAYRRLMYRLDDAGISRPSLSSFRRWAKQAQSAAAIRRAQAEILGVEPVTQPFPALDTAMAKLVKESSEEGGAVAMLDLALKTLPWREDETTAAQLLFSILLHDNLAEALDGRL